MVANIEVFCKAFLVLLFVQCNAVLSIYTEPSYPDQVVESTRRPNIIYFYPGTLWCGPGNISSSYDQLGRERDIDMCCRAHDSCPDNIAASETKFGLTNDSPFTVSSCKCNDRLRDCLYAVGSVSANILGRGYFNYLGMKCFKKDYPVTSCNLYDKPIIRRGRCLEYVYDTTKPKIYQFFDVERY